MDKEQLRHYKDLSMSDLLWVSQLVALRKRKKLTQQQVAQRMGVEQSTVSKLENVNNGRRKISAEQLNRYARAINAYTAHVVVDAEQDYRVLKQEVERHTHSLIWDENSPSASESAYLISDALPHNESSEPKSEIPQGWADANKTPSQKQSFKLICHNGQEQRDDLVEC